MIKGFSAVLQRELEQKMIILLAPTVRLADDDNGELFEFDPATNSRKTILRSPPQSRNQSGARR